MMCNLLSPDVTSRVAGHSVIYRQRQRISFEDSRKIIGVSASGAESEHSWVHTTCRGHSESGLITPIMPPLSQRALAKLVKLHQSTIAE